MSRTGWGMGNAVWFLFVIGSVVLFFSAWAVDRVAPESAPVGRGASYAEVRGCVSCHGDPDNPGIDVNNGDCSQVNSMSWHPDYSVACGDALAYFETVRLRRTFADREQSNSQNQLIMGERLARDYHCFQCHGHLGQGGFANTGSLKGYIPGYFGDDFKVLTDNADPDSVRRWITEGMDASILQKPVTGRIARFFFDRQAVSMPNFSSLPADEIETLVHYVIALNQLGPMTVQTVIDYSEQSQSREVSGNFRADNRPNSITVPDHPPQ